MLTYEVVLVYTTIEHKTAFVEALSEQEATQNADWKIRNNSDHELGSYQIAEVRIAKHRGES